MALYSVAPPSTGLSNSMPGTPSGRPVGALSVVKDASGKDRVYWRAVPPSSPPAHESVSSYSRAALPSSPVHESVSSSSPRPTDSSPLRIPPGSPEPLRPVASPVSFTSQLRTSTQSGKRPTPGSSTLSSCQSPGRKITGRIGGFCGRNEPADVCPRLASRIRVTVPPRVSEDGLPIEDKLVTVQLTLSDVDELMNLIEREQRASRRRCRQPVNQDLDEVVHQQRQELRILTAEMQKTKAALEEKGFLLEKERRQNAVLSRQLSLLRKLRDAERKGFQGSLKRAGCQLERELEKYVAAAYQQNLSFFGETTARDSAIGVNPDEEGQYGQATVQQDYESQACQFLGPPQESTVEGYERAEAMPGNAAEIEVTESVQFEEGADAEGVGDVEEGA